jgi:N-acetylmuramic acid 6-phosphate etherase
LLVKLILNTLSLLVMGRLDRFEGNVMTWVRASNGKLIDRTLRYLERLIEQRGLKPVERETLARMIFELQPTLKPDQPLILAVLQKIESGI